ncbi:MAG: hypothetical protein U0637_06545 [Phycisphaerales bacterium]
MNKNLLRTSVLAGVAAIAAVALWAGSASAARPGGGPCGQGIVCLDVWNPVTCPNGVTYSNSCYALKACQNPSLCWPSGAY